MTEMQWHSVEKKPWPFVAVTVRLPDDTETLAVWTGHIWWGTGRELTVAAWQPAQALRQSAA